MDWFELKNLVRTLVLPPAGPLLVACLGFALILMSRRRGLGMLLCALGLASLWALAMPVVSGQLMRIATPYPAFDWRQPPSAQAVVILAGGVRRYAPEYNADAPNEITWQRLAYGARLARETDLPVLVTGGRGEAVAMREFLIADFALTPRWVEEQARDTEQNALFSTRLLVADGVREILLVTSDWHMRRAVAEFELQGLRVVPAPVTDYAPPDGMLARWFPGAGALQDSRIVLYELLGNIAVRLRAYFGGAGSRAAESSPAAAETGATSQSAVAVPSMMAVGSAASRRPGADGDAPSAASARSVRYSRGRGRARGPYLQAGGTQRFFRYEILHA